MRISARARNLFMSRVQYFAELAADTRKIVQATQTRATAAKRMANDVPHQMRRPAARFYNNYEANCQKGTTMSTVDRSVFETMYAGKAPWDIGKPQKPFVEAADRITGSVLDAGCGTGDTALYLAGRGCRVTGIDFLEEPIRRARQKAAERGLNVTFLVQDALQLSSWKEQFDNTIDSGLFHVFGDEDRRRYVAALANVVKPGGRLFLLCFSNQEPGTEGPRRVSKKELNDAFARGWSVESIQPVQIEVRPDFKDMNFSPGGPKAWFAVIRREAPE
jgi:2-polyprenyl-3-methyl-5-hydroxy-6-metoxy-1,4-benzoquinol methylase